jgi:hypothetical protein
LLAGAEDGQAVPPFDVALLEAEDAGFPAFGLVVLGRDLFGEGDDGDGFAGPELDGGAALLDAFLDDGDLLGTGQQANAYAKQSNGVAIGVHFLAVDLEVEVAAAGGDRVDQAEEADLRGLVLGGKGAEEEQREKAGGETPQPRVRSRSHG